MPILMGLLAGVAAACGGERAERSALADVPAEADAAPGAGADVLGTIHATVDGSERTWYVVEGQSRGEPYASAMFASGDGVHLVALGGFDTADLPLDEFDVGMASMSVGSYEGSSIQFTIHVPEGRNAIRVELSESAHEGTVAFMPVVRMDDVLGHTLFSRSGSIEVTDATFGEAASLQGTFSAELALMDGSATMTMTDGRFEVSGVPRR